MFNNTLLKKFTHYIQKLYMNENLYVKFALYIKFYIRICILCKINITY